jgi:hypothetical protein
MGLFDFFRRKNGLSGTESAFNSISDKDIPESVFIEKEKPTPAEIKLEFGINYLFEFLDQNYERKGYDDALVNPDSSHMDQNVAALKNDLERTIRKVKTFYEAFIREIECHISSRGRSGMVDTVEELTAKKETAEEHVKQVSEIEQQAQNDQGIGVGIIISYKRGFRNGLAAISHHAMLKKNF